MKTDSSKLLLACLSVILVSCSSQNLTVSPSKGETPIIVVTTTPFQSKTPAFTPTVLQTITPEPTITMTPPPTLSRQISESEMRELIQNDFDCKPPCFLGVIPDKTTFGELQNIFLRFGVPLRDYERKGRAYAIESFSNSDVPLDAVFSVDNGIVKSTDVYISPSHDFEWSIYSPPAVLKRFGTPSKVTFGLQVVHEPSPTPLKGWYLMTFFYDDLDLVIQYIAAEIKLAKLITVCPNKDAFEGARIWLGKSPEYSPLPSQDGPLEEVTPFTLESFRDYLLLGPGACFDLKATAIPIY